MGFINLGKHLFQQQGIPEDCDVVFVSDMFVSDYVGGAELTSEALIKSSPLKIHKLKSADVTMDLLQKGHKKYWIFGNFSALNRELIPTICANMQYSVIEFDYKYCKYRSPEKHFDAERQHCDCENSENGKLISAFFYGAKTLWWMSELQQEHYKKLFPFLNERNNVVLSSVFDDETLAKINILRMKNLPKKGWIVIGSPSWIKGTDDAVKWCETNNLEYEVVWDIKYDDLLEKLAASEGLAFFPKGRDTCPRVVIEAKLLGCKLAINENVQHKDEFWFSSKDMLDTESYLYKNREWFWNGIKADIDYRPTISGYTTTKDCISQDYPFVESITSMLGFCNEVVIVDGGSTDGTWEKLQQLAASDGRIIVHQQVRDWNEKRFAVFDGMQKALARSLCTGEYCWQQDSDEVVHEDDYQKIKELVRNLPKSVPIVSLPVIEYWGSKDKVRFDINAWKWRLSQNLQTITHGIPDEMRLYDEDGNLYSKPGCDGCWYVTHDSYKVVPSLNFVTQDVENLRQQAFKDEGALKMYNAWFNQAVSSLPSVHHFSWFNIKRKIFTYRDYWSRHWCSLHNSELADTPENNMFFDKSWSDVTEQEIDELAKKLASDMGGWIFHSKLNFKNKTKHLVCNQDCPAIMSDWIRRNS